MVPLAPFTSSGVDIINFSVKMVSLVLLRTWVVIAGTWSHEKYGMKVL